MAKERKLPKIGVATAKLYQNAGFGMIANEMPFVSRVQMALRDEDIYTWVLEEDSKFIARVREPLPPGDRFRSDEIVNEYNYIQTDFESYNEAMEDALQNGLNLLIPKKDD